MAGIGIEVYAKINLGLAVVGRRDDGYHDIDTLFQTVSLADTVALESKAGGAGISLRVEGAQVPEGPSNLAWKAAAAVIERTGSPGVAIALKKRIPVAAGLAGGSADAAAVLVGMNELYGLGLGLSDLREIGLAIGSDVPFVVRGGTARGRGRGERIEQLPPLRGAWFVLVTPEMAVSAASAYGQARIGLTESAEFIRLNCSAIQNGDFRALARGLGNDLEAGVVSSYPEVGRVKARLIELGVVAAVMSGSGPTVLGVTTRKEDASGIASRLEGRGWQVHVAEPIETGCTIVR